MASIQKIKNGYRVQIKLLGIRDSKSFINKRDATIWASARKLEIRDCATKHPSELYTLRQALIRYAQEVSILKRGFRQESNRINALQRYNDYVLPLDVPLNKITNQHIATFRDYRLNQVGSSSVIKELSLLSAVFNIAKREWNWAKNNPVSDIRKPTKPKHRERVICLQEIKAMLKIMDYKPKQPIRSVSSAVAVCMLTAIRTGMRAGELCNLTWDNVHLAKKYVYLPITKNGNSRDVPLSTKAVRLIAKMQGFDNKYVFGLKTASLDALFRKYRQRANLTGFTFHDTRHTAATMLCKKVDALTLCKIFGWSSTTQALTYYNPTATNIANMLD